MPRAFCLRIGRSHICARAASTSCWCGKVARSSVYWMSCFRLRKQQGKFLTRSLEDTESAVLCDINNLNVSHSACTLRNCKALDAQVQVHVGQSVEIVESFCGRSITPCQPFGKNLNDIKPRSATRPPGEPGKDRKEEEVVPATNPVKGLAELG